ncbi:MAG: FAD:protein FMN transferase [Magnetococcales bacterium]|nr:FAD:protein FMN transferase [Magnetococcales bacterium]
MSISLRMRVWLPGVMAVVLLAVALWRPAPPAAPRAHVVTRLMMSTLMEITLPGLDEAQESEGARRAFEAMAKVEREMSPFDPSSPLSRVNAGPRGAWHRVPLDLARVVRAALAFQALSGGKFDPGLRPLTEAWGFSVDAPPTVPPPAALLDRWLALRVRSSRLPVELRDAPGDEAASEVRLADESVGLDLGGIAKGYAVDQAIAALRGAGVNHGIVNAGGNLRAIGDKGGAPWRVGVQDPRREETIVAVLPLRGDRSISTSGDYERYFLHEGERYHHILDPETARPSRSGVISATVATADAMSADALSTIVFILGAEKGLALLSGIPGAEGMVILSDGSQRATPGWVMEPVKP